MPSHYGNAVVLRVGTVYHCHCEERSDVAIRPPPACKKNGLPRQRARWLAMTFLLVTLFSLLYRNFSELQPKPPERCPFRG